MPNLVPLLFVEVALMYFCRRMDKRHERRWRNRRLRLYMNSFNGPKVYHLPPDSSDKLQ